MKLPHFTWPPSIEEILEFHVNVVGIDNHLLTIAVTRITILSLHVVVLMDMGGLFAKKHLNFSTRVRTITRLIVLVVLSLLGGSTLAKVGVLSLRFMQLASSLSMSNEELAIVAAVATVVAMD